MQILFNTMKAFLLALLFVVSYGCAKMKDKQGEKNDRVYVCGKGKRYHLSPTCRGLSNCHYKVVSMTLEKVKEQGKALCVWEKQPAQPYIAKGAYHGR